MIDIEAEHLLTPTEATKEPPLRNSRSGKPAHVAQVYRWIGQGARAVDGSRVRLEVLKLPAGVRTSREAITRFIKRLSDPAAVVIPSPSRRRDQINAAKARLQSAGIA